ncbi:F-box domain containing protein [Heracleum sosnowskyi]|uniref:F-box domain containing protein n=1 Tax=Heracleum sosnowskyi TaxID=360622 RepID=A0AAD8JHH5_9APIA|nr:F-box domain containing protein [Heracleum sosnowskyi]
MDMKGFSCWHTLHSFSELSIRSELCYDPQVELSCFQKVFSDQDLLTLILLRVVPVRKLVCFSSVSKLWHYIITAPRFSLLRSNCSLPLRTSALFFQINVCKTGVPNFISFVPLDNDIHTTSTSPFREFPFSYARDPRSLRVRIVHSCAGLLLCSSCPYSVLEHRFRYYVYNPTTNRLRTLPMHDHFYRPFAAVLAFDPSKSPHYRVFICSKPKTPEFTFPVITQFYIYSSETGTWSLSGQPFTSPPADNSYFNSVYCNGCIHWIRESVSVSKTPDRDVGKSIQYFNLDEEKLEAMPAPPLGLRSSRPVTFYMGVSQNHLHVVEVYACENILNVYEMENDYSGWFLKYEVDLSPISQVFPEMMMTPDQVYILSLVRRENFQEDSFLVLHIPGKPRKAIHYNLVDRCFKGIWDFTYPEYLNKLRSWFYMPELCVGFFEDQGLSSLDKW